MAAKSTKEVIEGGRLKRFFDRRLIKAIGHPLREHLLAVFNDRVASPTEIGHEIELEVPSFYKHVQLLEDLGCIERVETETRRRRGAKEHFFRAKGAITLDERAWQQLPASVRSDWVATHLQSIWDDAVAALQNGTFAIGGEPHVTWLPGLFDRVGQEEAKSIMKATMLRLLAVRERSVERLAATGEPGKPATIALMRFGTPG